MNMDLSCFKAYDIRGRLGDELNEDIAYRIGRAYAQYLQPARIAVGADVRPSSKMLKAALTNGLMDAGVDVVDLGMTGTEEVYFAAFHLDVDGAIEVTASHNPLDYNGMKLVRRGARPISGDTGLNDIKRLAETNSFLPSDRVGTLSSVPFLEPYVDHLLGYFQPSQMQPVTIVVDAGNGAAGHVIDAVEERFKAAGYPINFVKIHHEPDGTFPNGIPNPLLPENRHVTSSAVRQYKADMGIAWDGDFDRCFLFDEQGEFIEGYYIVGLLAASFLNRTPGEKIIHDPRLTWNTMDIVTGSNGVPVMSKTGHAFIKEKMRQENAIYGGEMSAHHYFRDFAYCDSGMIPWLLVLQLMLSCHKSLVELVQERIAAFPCSGELNYTVQDIPATIERIFSHYAPQKPQIDKTDGLSLAFQDWRFNVRGSNTEPLLRLNVESRGDKKLVEEKVAEIEQLITANR